MSELNINNCTLEHAVLHEPTFLPGVDGKGVNLKNTLSVNGVEGKSMGLELTLKGTMVFIKTKTASALLPLSNFKLVVPAKDATNS